MTETTTAYVDGIHEAWVGELQGEAFFAHLAQEAAGEEGAKWETLAELERVTGRRMASLLTARNVSLERRQPPANCCKPRMPTPRCRSRRPCPPCGPS